MRLMRLGGSHVVFIKSLRLLIRYKDVLDKQKKYFHAKKKKENKKKNPRNSKAFLCYEVRKWI